MSDNSLNGFVIRWQGLAVAMALLLNLAALIWGAAQLVTTVETLSARTAELSETIERVQATQVEILRRMDVLEDRSERK